MVKPSIQRKLRTVITLTSAIVLLLACAAFIAADRERAGRAMRDDLSSIAAIIAANTAAPLTFDDRQGAADVLSALKARPAIVAAAVYTREGKLFAKYGIADFGEAGTLPTEPGRIDVFHNVYLGDERVGSVFIGSDLREAEARMRQFASIAAVILLASLLVAWFLSWWLEQRITAPILDLAAAAQQVTMRRNYAVRVNPPAAADKHDEIGTLMLGFNEMLSEIERRDHELHRHREDLEHQVSARTAELSTANVNLVAAKETAERGAEINAQLSGQRQMILNAAGEGILGVDRSGAITFINPTGAALFGSPVETLVGRQVHGVIHPKDGGFDGCPICENEVSWTEPVTKIRLFKRSGGRIPVEFTVRPTIDETGLRSGIVATFRDVTERLAVERMKDEFVSTVSHELRTPLTSIRGALGLLASGLIGNVGDKAARMLQIAVSNTDRLVRLINDILDLERMQSGRVELNKTSMDAGAVMREAVEGVQSVADAAGVTLAVTGGSAFFTADRDRIIQTLTNLLGNAVKFSPAGTAVALSCDVVEARILFSVRDAGRGIPPDKIETIFEKFKQVDASDSREKGGSGLGLAICRTIVAAHGGRIWVESNEAGGSTFHFTIPANEEGGVARATTNRVVVVCAGTPGAAESRSRALEQRGYTTRIVALPGMLVETTDVSRADVVVLDFPSPSADLRQSLGALKGSAATAHVPVVLVTADHNGSLDEGRRLIDRRLTTPCSDGSIADAVNAVCSPRTVLIVENDVDLARVEAEALRTHGVRTIHATTGNEAIAICEREPPTLVILDVALPELDGYGVVARMRRNETLARVPLIVFSAAEVSAADQERLRLGPTVFLTKSRVSLEELTRCVVQLLDDVVMEAEGAA